MGSRSSAPPPGARSYPVLARFGGCETWVLLGAFDDPEGAALHGLLRAARAGAPDAVAEVLAGVARAAPDACPAATDATVVAVPGHQAGSPGSLAQHAAGATSAARGWHLAEGALTRRAPAPEGKLGGPRDAGAEAMTLEWRAPPDGQALVLVDDVVRSGATLGACLAAMRRAGERRPVFAIVVAAVRVGSHTMAARGINLP